MNDLWNWLRIFGTLLFFWAFQAMHWWGVFELGIAWTDTLMWYSVCIFIFTILVGAGLLTSGKYANKKKRYHDYLQDKISELKAEKLEADIRKKQEDEFAKRNAAKAS